MRASHRDLDLDGKVTTSTTGPLDESKNPPFTDLFARADSNGVVSGIAAANDEPFQIVLVPVKAPQRIGWVGMGFIMDARLASEFKQLTGLEISFAVGEKTAGLHLYSTCPAPASARAGMAIPARQPLPATVALAGDDYFTHEIVLDHASGVARSCRPRWHGDAAHATLNRRLLTLHRCHCALPDRRVVPRA